MIRYQSKSIVSYNLLETTIFLHFVGQRKIACWYSFVSKWLISFGVIIGWLKKSQAIKFSGKIFGPSHFFKQKLHHFNYTKKLSKFFVYIHANLRKN